MTTSPVPMKRSQHLAHALAPNDPPASAATFAAIARETKRKIDWDHILRGYNTSVVQWKWLENVRNFSIYTRQGDSADSFGVLAIGSVKGSVGEVVALLQSSRQDEYEQKMAALHGKAFKRGTYITDVAVECRRDGGKSSHLSVRSVTFAKSSWLQPDDEWCYLDSSHHDETQQHYEKLLTTLTADDMASHFRDGVVAKGFRTKRVANLIGGYYVQSEDDAEESNTSRGLARSRPTTSRVYYYADMTRRDSNLRNKTPLAKGEMPTKTTRQLMLRLARNCDRLALFVRRRRLGVQVLIDQRRVFPPTNVKCGPCEKTQLLAKLCVICGEGVCGDCSSRYERETCVSGAKRIELVRVCDPCLARVENADYSHVSDVALAGPAVFPDAVLAAGHATPSSANGLKTLLQDALLQASSPQRKGAVMSVIRCVLDQERAAHTQPTESSERDSLSSVDQCLDALNGLAVDQEAHSEVELSGRGGRSYALQANGERGFPLPENEAQRLQAIDRLGILTDGACEELNIICDLAAKEVGALASIVSIITRDEQRVVGANNPVFSAMHVRRDQSFCTHTIMDTKPLIIAHPEADVRVSHIAIPSALSVRFYCGFPLKAEDDTVIGSLCCVDQKSHQLTESQFSSMLKLANTASKIIRVREEKRRASHPPPGLLEAKN